MRLASCSAEFFSYLRRLAQPRSASARLLGERNCGGTDPAARLSLETWCTVATRRGPHESVQQAREPVLQVVLPELEGSTHACAFVEVELHRPARPDRLELRNDRFESSNAVDPLKQPVPLGPGDLDDVARYVDLDPIKPTPVVHSSRAYTRSAADLASSNDVPADVVEGVTRDPTVPEPIGQHVVCGVVTISPVHDTLTLETSSQASDSDRAGQDESHPAEDAHRLTMPSLKSVAPPGSTGLTRYLKDSAQSRRRRP